MSSTVVHQPSESFVKQVQSVAAAEADAKQKVEQAQAEAARIHAEAQAKTVQISAAAADKALVEKNKSIASARAKTEEGVARILQRAAVRGRELSARRLSDAAASEISETV